jgi:PEGA domain
MLAPFVLLASILTQAPVPTLPDALGKLVVLADAAGTRVVVDGEPQGTVPVSLSLDPGLHAIRFEAPGLPPFHVDVEVVGTGRTEIAAKLAQQRPPADFSVKKDAYDSAMFSLGLKGIAGLCGCGLGLAALSTGTILAFTPAPALAAVGTLIGGGVGCLGGTGLCGWAVLDMFGSPEEPIIPRVHVIKVTPPTGAAESFVIEIEAPPVDSDGEPIGADEDEGDTTGQDGEDGIVEASVRY